MLLKKLLAVEKKKRPEKRYEWAENAWGQPIRVEKQ